MSKIYEIDPEADTLIIVSAAPSPATTNGTNGTNGTTIPSKRPKRSDVRVVNGVDDPQPGDLRIKASSKHLSLASRPLRNKLSTSNGNSPTVQYDGRVHLRIDGYDPTAVTIVLNALHGKSSRVPKALDLDSIAKIAAFVQAFQCHEAVEAYAEGWIERLGAPGKRVGGNTAAWVFVSYVFRQHELFRVVTRTAIAQGTGSVGGQALRIPERVIDAIETRRRQLVGKAVSVMHKLIADLSDGSASCPQGCDLMLLGALVKARHLWQLSEPYSGITFEAITRSLRELQDQVWYIGAPFPGKPGEAPASGTKDARKDRFLTHYCHVRSLINPKLYALEVSVDGLDLDELLDS